MKFLKIEDNKGYFSLDGTTWNPIDEINKEHLLKLLDLSLSDDFEMDDFEKEKVGNQAHQIIYKNIFEKFSDVSKNRSRFKDESEVLYKAAIEKYSQ
ncbi:MAG: hypothetical protein ACLQBC_10845 [Syntrophales bacterium]